MKVLQVKICKPLQEQLLSSRLKIYSFNGVEYEYELIPIFSCSFLLALYLAFLEDTADTIQDTDTEVTAMEAIGNPLLLSTLLRKKELLQELEHQLKTLPTSDQAM